MYESIAVTFASSNAAVIGAFRAADNPGGRRRFRRGGCGYQRQRNDHRAHCRGYVGNLALATMQPMNRRFHG